MDDATGNERNIEPVVDLRGVVPGHRPRPEEIAQQRRTRPGDLVQDQSATSHLGRYREQTRTRRRLKYQLARLKCGSEPCHPGQSKRCRKLLQADHLFTAPCLGWNKPGDAFDEFQPFERIGGPGVDGRAISAHEEKLRDFERFIGEFPVPGTTGVGRTERGLHGGAHDRGIDTATGGEMTEKVTGLRL